MIYLNVYGENPYSLQPRSRRISSDVKKAPLAAYFESQLDGVYLQSDSPNVVQWKDL